MYLCEYCRLQQNYFEHYLHLHVYTCMHCVCVCLRVCVCMNLDYMTSIIWIFYYPNSNHNYVYIYVMCKVWIRTIRRFCCANFGSEPLHSNPSIAHTILGSENMLHKLGICTLSSKIRKQTLGIRSNKIPINRIHT